MARPMRAALKGLGAALPERVMKNAEFEAFLDTSDEWITTRTGIKERRIAAPGESTADLGTRAARAALDDAGIAPTDLDLILCATITTEMPFPATACFIQDAIGATGVPAFDVSAACSGWLYGLAIASQFIETGRYKRILVVGAECLTRFCDFQDRGSCILFGDGAGAIVLEATDQPNKGICYNVMHADGAGWDYIHVPAGGARTPATAETVANRLHYIRMRGRDVYRFAIEKMQWLLEDCMRACNLTVDDVDLVIPHQVNIRIIQSATSKLKFPMEKVYVNIDRYGNTSAASIPVAMEEARRAGRIRPDMTLLLVAFGAGLTWAGTVLRT